MKILDKPWTLAFCRFAIVLLTLLVGAGNVTNSALMKWGFRDAPYETNRFSLHTLMDGTAAKPFVYRSSFARAEKWAVSHVPPDVFTNFHALVVQNDHIRHQYFTDMSDQYWTPLVAVTYYLTYFAVVAVTVAALGLVYRLARLQGLTFGQSLGCVAAFSFVYPLTFQQGAYYYDFIELLGALTACWFVLKRQLMACTLAVALFSFNKETFFLVPLALFFLHERDVSWQTRVGWLVAQLACCAVSRHVIMSGYERNAGGAIEFHLVENLRFWLDPGTYLRAYNIIGRGVFTPSLQNPLLLVPLVVYFRAAWRMSDVRYRRFFHASVWPVVVLYALFGYLDETRAFATAFPAFTLIALSGASRFGEIFSGLQATAQRGSSIASEPVLQTQRES